MTAHSPTPALDALPTKGVFRLRGLNSTRIETFTDAAFAFALTLLVISLEPPRDVPLLLSAMREIPAFVASGIFLMIFWWGHHEWSRRFGLDDGPSVILSCLLVFTVLIYVVPLRFMFTLFFTWIEYSTGLPLGSRDVLEGGPPDVGMMFFVYSLGFVAMSGALMLLNVYTWRVRDSLTLDALEAHETLAEAGVWAILALTGLASALLAVATPLAQYGAPGWVYMILPVAIPLYARRMDRRRPERSP